MPFCSHCGAGVQDHDRFCAQCAAPQPVAGVPPPGRTVPPRHDSEPFSPRTAAILSYVPVIGWIAAVIVLASRRYRDNHVVRFHAFQGLYLFALHLLLEWAIRPIFQNIPGPMVGVYAMMQAVIFGVSIFMMVKTSQGEKFMLPFLGELAERSALEQ
ncbi:MAG TPA: zinc-ribbon domain-containing protein [Tepidisphaeraceae bacterium]